MRRGFNHRVHKGKKRGHRGKSFAFWRTFEVSKTSKVFLLIHRSGAEGFFTTEVTEGKGEDTKGKASLFGEPLRFLKPRRVFYGFTARDAKGAEGICLGELKGNKFFCLV
jgi:hypothetical protein